LTLVKKSTEYGGRRSLIQVCVVQHDKWCVPSKFDPPDASHRTRNRKACNVLSAQSNR
jgi:hypothetical protein